MIINEGRTVTGGGPIIQVAEREESGLLSHDFVCKTRRAGIIDD